jgi:hypothetical protein
LALCAMVQRNAQGKHAQGKDLPHALPLSPPAAVYCWPLVITLFT